MSYSIYSICSTLEKCNICHLADTSLQSNLFMHEYILRMHFMNTYLMPLFMCSSFPLKPHNTQAYWSSILWDPSIHWIHFNPVASFDQYCLPLYSTASIELSLPLSFSWELKSCLGWRGTRSFSFHSPGLAGSLAGHSATGQYLGLSDWSLSFAVHWSLLTHIQCIRRAH